MCGWMVGIFFKKSLSIDLTVKPEGYSQSWVLLFHLPLVCLHAWTQLHCPELGVSRELAWAAGRWNPPMSVIKVTLLLRRGTFLGN